MISSVSNSAWPVIGSVVVTSVESSRAEVSGASHGRFDVEPSAATVLHCVGHGLLDDAVRGKLDVGRRPPA